jgi:hypothetical protein
VAGSKLKVSARDLTIRNDTVGYRRVAIAPKSGSCVDGRSIVGGAGMLGYSANNGFTVANQLSRETQFALLPNHP